MTAITHEDLIHIVTGAVGMAKQDNLLTEQEKKFLKHLMNKAGVEPDEVMTGKLNFKAIAGQLSSKRAKQVFLLALAAVAKSDMHIEAKEQKFLYDMAKTLDVGIVEIEMHSRAVLEKMVLDHLQD